MSAIYDNWERLVAAAIKKQQLWDLFHEQSRSPSILSDASSSLSSLSRDLSFHEYSSPPQLVLLSDFSPPLDVEHIVDRASTKFLGRGTFGSAYVATINDVKKFVVKSVKISEVDFKRALEVVGDVRHENVVALRAYYSSSSSSSSSPHKLLLSDYYSNGSMYSLLFGENRGYVGWETRVKIAVGAARGIAQIHTQLLVHGNIKASNILLDLHLYGCVSDLGFTNTTKTTQNASDDVYTFGILLLELLTRKSSTGTDLIKLINSVKSKERAAKVFDPDLMKHPSIREQMVEMLQIGMRCVAKSSKKRPNISEVVKMLEDINVVSNPLEGEVVFLDYAASPIFELEHLYKAPAELLGKGSFGNSYKATLDNGNIVTVKRLINLTATLKDLHQHMEVFGRMNHTNVGRLKAYYYGRDEKFLVYDYFHQGSLSDVQHRGTTLDWDTRLKVAVGAARGIAHIHTQNGGRLVLGNIKSSNILINGQDCSIGFDAGLPNLMNPRPSLGYSAPEAISGEVSQASDVYSFGVVLLELVSGRPADSLVEWIRSVNRSEWGAQVLDVERCGYENEVAMMRVFRIAMCCVSSEPSYRPKIFGVVKKLEKTSRVGAEIALDDDEIVLADRWAELSIQTRLEWLLEYLLPMLSPRE